MAEEKLLIYWQLIIQLGIAFEGEGATKMELKSFRDYREGKLREKTGFRLEVNYC